MRIGRDFVKSYKGRSLGNRRLKERECEQGKEITLAFFKVHENYYRRIFDGFSRLFNAWFDISAFLAYRAHAS